MLQELRSFIFDQIRKYVCIHNAARTSMKRSALSGMPTACEKGVAMNRYCAANSVAANRARTASGTHLRRLPLTILTVCL